MNKQNWQPVNKRKEPYKLSLETRMKLSEAKKGSKNPQWNCNHSGYLKRGYKLVRNSDYSAKERYRFEHRLIMEQYLGRKLLKEEVIHHLNGDTKDNRIENLELWTLGHPHGIRVEDLVNLYLPIIKKILKG